MFSLSHTHIQITQNGFFLVFESLKTKNCLLTNRIGNNILRAEHINLSITMY